MSSVLGQFRQHLTESLSAIESHDSREIASTQTLSAALELVRTKISKIDFPLIQPVRTVHHFSCTGGTLIAKCIASMANTVVLNEIDLFSSIPFRAANNRFTPTDILALLNQAGSPASDELIVDLFLDSIDRLREHYSRRGQYLVLRDHTHSHYLYGRGERSVSDMRSLLMQANIPCVSMVTVRDPIRSYASMVKKGWENHIQPASFDEYCQRYLRFLTAYAGVKIVKYEDFVSNPKKVMRDICNHLSLTYFDRFEEVFDSFDFSGDSGRSSGKIEPRPNLELTEPLRNEILSSESYTELAAMLKYEPLGK
ncbi:MAG: sulfotransferase [Pseudomonadota bacterium]